MKGWRVDKYLRSSIELNSVCVIRFVITVEWPSNYRYNRFGRFTVADRLLRGRGNDAGGVISVINSLVSYLKPVCEGRRRKKRSAL